MATSRRGDSYARYALGLLLLVYTFNFIDRVILGILVPPIKAELHLTDTELGLLGGTAFALFYTALGVPIGWLADRFNRVWIMTIALALWSAFSGASGLAQNFFQLFLARLGVGIGEAGGVAPAYSLISDYFPSARRARPGHLFIRYSHRQCRWAPVRWSRCLPRELAGSLSRGGGSRSDVGPPVSLRDA
jgi:MFS family permease